MKKFSINVLKILILLALGLCIFSITSKVNAGTTTVNKQLTINVGEMRKNLNPGIETKYGEITSIKVNDPKCVKTEKQADNLKFSIYGLKATQGTIIKVEFYRKSSLKCMKSTVIYSVKVVDNATINFKQGDKAKEINPGMISEYGNIYSVISSNTKVATVTTSRENKVVKGKSRITVTPQGVGTATITVKFCPSTWTSMVTKKYKVTVKTVKKVLSRIEVETNPKKIEYTVGEKFNPSGLTLRAIYSDKTAKKINYGFKCSPSTIGKNTKMITISYENKTCQVKIIAKLGNSQGQDQSNTNIQGKVNYAALKELKYGDVLELKSGRAWWTYSSHTGANLSTGKKYMALKGNDKVKILEIDGNWLQIEIAELSNSTSKKNFKVGQKLFIYYGSTAASNFTVK